MATVGTHHLSSSAMASSAPSRLSLMQARLREQLMVEKESRLLEMAARQAAQQEGTIQRVTRSSSSSLNSSLSSISSSNGQGRVRRMFEERRQNGFSSSPVGRDKSYPLDPVGRGGGGGGGSGGGGSGGNRPQMKGVVRSNRGVSMDRSSYALSTNDAMKRSKSHAALPRPAHQHADPVRSPARGLRPPQTRTAPQYKSTSSLLDANQNYSRNSSYSRDPSPSPTPPNGAPSRANRFGFRATSRGPSPAPSPDGHSSPGRGVPPTGPRRTNTFTHSRSNNSLLQPDSLGEYRTSPTSPATPEPPTPRRNAPLPRPPQRNNRLIQENRDEVRRAQLERRKETAAAEGVTQSRSSEETQPQLPPKPAVPDRPPRLAKSKGAPAAKSRGPSIPRQNNNNNDENDGPGSKPIPNKPPFGGNGKEETAPQRRPLAASNPPNGLVPCKVCGRNFAPDRIEKHTTICTKSTAKAKKRKKFDPVKMRTKGTEAEKFVARGQHLKQTPKAKKSDWRKKHEDFIATVRAAKGVKGYEAPPMDTSDYVQCRHCGRKFAESVAERHIPKCASIQSNKPAAGRRR